MRILVIISVIVTSTSNSSRVVVELVAAVEVVSVVVYIDNVLTNMRTTTLYYRFIIEYYLAILPGQPRSRS